MHDDHVQASLLDGERVQWISDSTLDEPLRSMGLACRISGCTCTGFIQHLEDRRICADCGHSVYDHGPAKLKKERDRESN
jgi:hypothetical protein